MNETENVHKALNIGAKLRIYQVKVEGISSAKSEFLSKQFVEENIDIGVVQETHSKSLDDLIARGNIMGYDVVVSEFSRSYGIATYVKQNLKGVKVITSNTVNNICTSTIAVGSMKVTNVYKAPASKWPHQVLGTFPHPAVYIGDFNSYHSEWSYHTNDENGEFLVNWAATNELYLVYDAKEKGTFARVHIAKTTTPTCVSLVQIMKVCHFR